MPPRQTVARLSDVQLAQWLYRDLLFRQFCHIELGAEVPEASTKLVEHDLWDLLLGETNRQIEAKNIIMTEGRINIIDATQVEAAQSSPGKGVSEQATHVICKRVGMSRITAGGVPNPLMGIQFIPVWMRVGLYIVVVWWRGRHGDNKSWFGGVSAT